MTQGLCAKVGLCLALALGGLGAACDGSKGQPTAKIGEIPSASDSGNLPPATPRPPLTLSKGPPRALEGQPLERVDFVGLQQVVKGFEGRPLVLHLWVGWGGPERELRALAGLHRELGSKVAFLGVCGELLNRADTPETLASLMAHLEATKVGYDTVLYTGGGEALFAWSGATRGLPATLVLGPDGTLWARYLRPVKAGDILDTLRVYGAVPEETP